jgi:hypothetical protein
VYLLKHISTSLELWASTISFAFSKKILEKEPQKAIQEMSESESVTEESTGQLQENRDLLIFLFFQRPEYR